MSSEHTDDYNATVTHFLALEQACIQAHLARLSSINVTLQKGAKTPEGFPKVELLSINPSTGARNYAVDPLRVLLWMRTLWLNKAAT